jgi:hypothetical protein
MKRLIPFLLLFYSTAHANNNQGVDWKTFSANQSGQVFKDSDRKELQGGFLVGGDDMQYYTWSGNVSNYGVYIEVHNHTIKLRIGKRWVTRKITRAITLSPENKTDFDRIDPPYLYIKSANKPADTLICLDNIQPNYPFFPYAYESGAYVLVDPMGAARLYKMPSTMASCMGLIKNRDGKLAVPKWDIAPFSISDKEHLASPPPKFTIQYYQLEPAGFSKTGEPITGHYLSNDDRTFNDHFVIDR